jgi:hypothetical protein
MYSQPNNAETATAKKSNSFEVLRKAISKFSVLIGGHIGPNIEFVLISLVDLDGFLFVVLVLTDVALSFLQTVGLLLLLTVLLFLPIEKLS